MIHLTELNKFFPVPSPGIVPKGYSVTSPDGLKWSYQSDDGKSTGRNLPSREAAIHCATVSAKMRTS